MSLDNWARPYLQECPYKPFLFYAVLGRFEVDEQFQEATSVLPAGLDLRVVEGGFFRDGVSWELCKKDFPEVAKQAEDCPQAVVLKGAVESQDSLDYLKGTLDFLTFLTDVGGEVVYDPFALNWYSAADWNALMDEGQIFNPFDHTVVLLSEEPEGTWLHTRGMLKFGRPDLSVRGLSGARVEQMKKVLDRFIGFQALGGVVETGREIMLDGKDTGYRPGEVVGSLEDPEFNNYHVELTYES